jgi:tetratricopeptide (TPR) repeat protein
MAINIRKFPQKNPSAIVILILLSGFSIFQFVQASRFPHRPAGMYYNLGNAYLHQGELKKALDRFKTAYSLKPDHPELLTNMAKAHYLMGNNEAAISFWSRAHLLRPEYPIPLYNLAKAYQKRDIQKSKAYWRSYLKVAKKIPDERKYVIEGEKLLKQWDGKIDDQLNHRQLDSLR